jgi:ABC-type transport system involved in multi-copper enzyme maturation permease subunit
VWKIILKREVQQNFYSMRFLVSLALVLSIFIAGSLSFVRNHEAVLEKDRIGMTMFLDKMKADAAANATVLAITKRDYPLRPRDDSFISDAKEKYLPNEVTFSAWNVFSFGNRSGSANPFLTKHDELNWSFIVGLIVSFVILLFTFDAVSGEKESKTLALSLSNSVSRGTLLLAKYLSAVVSVLFLIVPGVLLSLLIVLVIGRTSFSAALAAETAGFLTAAVLIAASFAAFGLLASTLVRSANVSLLIALSIWLLFAVVIPNSSGFVAKRLFPIRSTQVIQANVDAALDDLAKSAPRGSWMLQSQNPFLPYHELRATIQRKLMQAEKAIRDNYYKNMFLQFERTRLIVALSPISDFEYFTEAAVGGGYLRFRKIWEDFHVYQGQLFTFFQSLDARDPASPHWFNPYEDVSTTRKPVPFEEVPLFQEKPLSFADRLSSIVRYLLANAILVAIIFYLTYVLFIRYDVR